jgi:hypothetical protein
VRCLAIVRRKTAALQKRFANAIREDELRSQRDQDHFENVRSSSERELKETLETLYKGLEKRENDIVRAKRMKEEAESLAAEALSLNIRARLQEEQNRKELEAEAAEMAALEAQAAKLNLSRK